MISEQRRATQERMDGVASPAAMGMAADGTRSVPRDIPGTRPGGPGSRSSTPPQGPPTAPPARPGMRRGTAMDALSIFGGLVGG